ncbi:MAG: polysaccharide pyruvyl transferase family protein [Oscillospiraceae bacterium]|nr:polysaccharide pyruvyl transferase family protein [Oscillospiraceae bacterium]
MMKKVGIITFHFAVSFGAVLQSYALRNKIKSFHKMDADIINYVPRNWAFPNYKEPKQKRRYIEQINKFNKFRREAIGIEGESFDEFTAYSLSKYDYLITGSDQVWNSGINRNNDCYYLDFASGAQVKIAYAASLGKSLAGIARRDLETYERFIPNFDFISVREKTHVDLIQQFTDQKVVTTLDPTLLLCARSYEQFIERPLCKDKYILLLLVQSGLVVPHILSFADKVSKKFAYNVIHSFFELPSYAIKHSAGSFKFAGIEEFLSLVKNAELIITDSYHGTIFSILFGRPFYSFVNQMAAPRVCDLLNEFGLTERIIEKYKPISDVSLDINFDEAYLRLEELRNASVAFLRRALSCES